MLPSLLRSAAGSGSARNAGAVTADGRGRSMGGATEVPPPNLVLLPRRSVRWVRPLLAFASGAGPRHGMDGQPRGAHRSASDCSAAASRTVGSWPGIPAPRSPLRAAEWAGGTQLGPALSAIRAGADRRRRRRRPRAARGRGRANQTAASPGITAAGVSKPHFAQRARREVELGPPGLLRRPQRRSHTGGTGPTLVAPSRLACIDPTQGSRSPTSRLVVPRLTQVGPSPGGGCLIR
jgi:hypothetical protein